MSIYETLNPMQQEAVCHTEGPLLILAGAGSGKTRVLTHRIAWLIDEKGVNPWNILAITFTNKAAGEMRERVDDIVGFGSEQIWVSTFHSACVRILRRFADHLGYERNFVIYDTDDQKSVIKEICKRLNIDTKIYKERALLSAISSAKNEMIDAKAYALNVSGDFGKQRIADVYGEYEKVLYKNNAMDFDDLLVKTVEVLRNNEDVLNYYQERFKYIMVDEYQDTNTVQFRLVSLLAGKYRNLCVVGDDDQSIYKFRGANIYNILNFEKEFSDAKVIKLEQNYRSTQTILDAANSVIRHNKGRKEKTLWTANEVGDKIVFHQYQNEYDEAYQVVEEISRVVSQGKAHYNDYAILYRTNAQSRVLEEKFVARSIPYKIVGGINFYQRREIKDILAYLKTIDNGRDDLAVRRIINVPKRGIGMTTLNRVIEYGEARDMSFFDALECCDDIPRIGKTGEKIKGFVNMIEVFRAQSEYITLAELLTNVLEETGYIKELEEEDTEVAQGRIENIDELMNKIVAYEEEEEEPTLSGFLENVALVSDIDSLDEAEDYVMLMTLHSAKGLEFPYVYMCGMEDGLFPSYMTIVNDDPEEIEEERRLCYVGITRAKKRLTMTYAKSRMVRGSTQYNMLSRFVKEISPELFDLGAKPEKTKQESRIQRPSDFSRKQTTKVATAYGKAFQVNKAAALDYTVGDMVRHIKFGVGTVINIVDGGKDYEVTVDFEKSGVKKMFASFAKLKLID
ncbi:DNA helicase PcrA [Frisingicoccus caecimuris]|uniref:ATP-dependent DNA helicase n=1 Tax=Frisingicoccus caecimuris TaxID=1796636 RepID=A0A4R2LC82_9FIRM|nr:DNA helicase PcrA [Frisingicoccus caecimuris]MCR1917617.1 DNA helicase PcrA [Frisingicoccus caecimuris]TCO85887.1 DNA helicase-2/ATP-dependent DNA helicase PcrA [Frisingicoccus caecimuris]